LRLLAAMISSTAKTIAAWLRRHCSRAIKPLRALTSPTSRGLHRGGPPPVYSGAWKNRGSKEILLRFLSLDEKRWGAARKRRWISTALVVFAHLEDCGEDMSNGYFAVFYRRGRFWCASGRGPGLDNYPGSEHALFSPSPTTPEKLAARVKLWQAPEWIGFSGHMLAAVEQWELAMELAKNRS